jgi:hypothetical protein
MGEILAKRMQNIRKMGRFQLPVASGSLKMVDSRGEGAPPRRLIES